MTRRIFFTVAAATLVLIAGSRPAQAQTRYDFKIPFDFVASGKTFTAGEYAFMADDEGTVMTLEARDPKGRRIVIPVETRLAERRTLPEPELVFDKVGGKLYVSELLSPGEDGCLMLATKAKHTHESVKGSKKES